MSVHVFLSHNWGKDISGRDNHDRVVLINKELEKIGYQTWLDTERITGGLVEKMIEGIEQADGVIAFITRRYYEKVKGRNARDNCYIEFEYASRKKTKLKMVAVIMEKCMCDTKRWIGLISVHLGGEKFIDMSGDLDNRAYLSKQMEALDKELQSKGIKPLLQPKRSESLPGISISIST